MKIFLKHFLKIIYTSTPKFVIDVDDFMGVFSLQPDKKIISETIFFVSIITN